MPGLASIGSVILTMIKLADRCAPPPRKWKGGTLKAGGEVGFALYREPRGRFELRHPASWTVVPGDGVHVHSPALGSFAGVGPVAAGSDPWKILSSQITAEKGSLHLTRRREGVEPRAWGELQLADRTFRWDGIVKGGWLLLIGDVVDAKRTRAVELYEDRVLRAIRRSFLVPAGSRGPQA